MKKMLFLLLAGLVSNCLIASEKKSNNTTYLSKVQRYVVSNYVDPDSKLLEQANKQLYSTIIDEIGKQPASSILTNTDYGEDILKICKRTSLVTMQLFHHMKNDNSAKVKDIYALNKDICPPFMQMLTENYLKETAENLLETASKKPSDKNLLKKNKKKKDTIEDEEDSE